MNKFLQGIKKLLAGFLALIILTQPLTTFGYSYFDGQNFVNVSTPEFSGDPGYASSATGAFSYTVDLAIPAGRSGMTPNIGLSYSSQNKDEHNIFGYGWSGVTQYVERKNLTGTNRLYIDDYFTSSMSGDLEVVSTTTNSTYVPQNQGTNFMDYEFDGSSWTVKDKKGTTYTYGTQSDSRLSDTTDATRVSRWYLEKQEDRNGNYVEYTYQKVSGQVYPNTIYYTGNGTDQGVYRVEFELRSRPAIEGYAPAFKVTTDQIVDQINVFHDTNKIQQYDLTHIQSVDSGREMLEKVEKTAYQPNIQTITLGEFDYSESNWSLTEDTNMTPRDENYSIYNGGLRHNGSGVTIDLSGDGRTEMGRIDRSDRSAAFTYNPALDNWTETDTGTAYNQLAPYTRPYAGPADLRGQSRIHRIFPHNNACSNSYNYSECRDKIGGSDGDGMNVDLNGDGRTDVAWVQTEGVGWKYEFLTFNSYNPDVISLDSSTLLFDRSPDDGPHMEVNLFTDWNNDGLIDIVMRDPAMSDYSSMPKVYLNGGKLNFKDDVFSLEGTEYSPYISNRRQDGYLSSYSFVDINGDGISDIGQSIVSNPDLDNLYSAPFKIKKVSSEITMDSHTLPFAFARWYRGSIDPHGVWFMDINHDGMLDAVINRSSHTDNERYFINQGQIPDMMSSVVTDQGAIMTPEYKRTTQLVDEAGNLQNPNLYTPLMVVDKVSVDNGLGDVQEIKYDYHNGVFTYESLEKKKLAGFEKIEKTHIGKEQVITTYYHQGNENNNEYKEHGDSFEKIGKPYRVSTSDIDGNVVHDIFNTWTTGNRNGGSEYVYLSQTVSRDYTIGKTEYIDKAQSYEYNNIHGGIIKHTEWGEVNYSKNQDKVTDIKNDKRYTVTQYAVGNDVYLPSDKQVLNSQDKLMSHGRHYYDNQVLGVITTGNVTTESHWLDTDSSWIDTSYTYNSFGQPLTSTDARGNVTTTAYDVDNMYAASVTNDLNQAVSYEYDFVTGQMSKSTDPNGIVSESIFDGFGRVIEKKQSTPTGGMVTVELNSYDDISMPRSVTTQQYFTNTPKYTYTYVDGLGRTLQSKQSTSNGDYQTNSYVYGATGILTVETQPYVSSNTNYISGIPSGVLSVVYEYDERDRVIEQSKPSGSETYNYHQWGKTTIDPNGYHKKELYDAFGNLIEVQEDIDTILSSAPISNATTTPYEFKKRITIKGKEGAGTDYQVLLKVGKDSTATSSDFHLGDYAYHFPQTRNDGGDLVFYNNAEDEMLPFWVEKVEDDIAHVWVKVSDSLEENVDIFIYYGHNTPTNYSDGESTFIFFDEFETSVVDTTKWQENDNGGFLQITDGRLFLENTEDGASWQTIPTFGPKTAIRWEGMIQEASYADSKTGYSSGQYFISDTDDNPQERTSAGEYDEVPFVHENHIFEIDRRSESVTDYLIDNDLKNSGGGNFNEGAFMMVVHEVNDRNNVHSDVDWIMVRKSNNLHPEFLSAGSEEGLAQVSATYVRVASASSSEIDLGTPEELEESIIEINEEEFTELKTTDSKQAESVADEEVDQKNIETIKIKEELEGNSSVSGTTEEVEIPVEGNLIVTGDDTDDATSVSASAEAASNNEEETDAVSSVPTREVVATSTASTTEFDVEILEDTGTSTQDEVEFATSSEELSTSADEVVIDIDSVDAEIQEVREYNGIPSTKPAKSYRFKELNYPLIDKITKTEAQVLNLENKLLKKKQTLVNIDGRIDKLQKRISDLEVTKQKRESKGRDISSQIAKIEKLENTIEKITSKKEKVQDRVSVLKENKDEALVLVVKQKERLEKQKAKAEKKEKKTLLDSATEAVQDFFSIPTADASTWANSLYDYKKTITLRGESELSTDYPLLLKIGLNDTISDVDFHLDGLAQHFPLGTDDGGDLIFYNNDESATMPFWVEKVENDTVYVWVKITDDLSQDQKINVYYGNSTPVNYSGMNNVFPFVDDFSNPLDSNMWDVDSVAVINGRAVFDDSVSGDAKLTSIQSFGPGHEMVSQSEMVEQTYSNTPYNFFGFDSASMSFRISKYWDLFDVGVDHIVSTTWEPNGNFVSYIDGELYKAANYTTAEPILIRQWNPYINGQFAVDWIYVRPLVETEPAISLVEQVLYRVPQGNTEGITATNVIGVTQYEYDVLDQLVKIIDAEDNEREFTYDSLGRQTSSELPHTSTSTAATHTYTYDVVGNKTSETRPNGSVINYAYDDLNRVLTVDNPAEGASAEVLYSYDSATNGVGKLAGVSGDGYTKTYQYDNAGNMSVESVNVGGTLHTTSMTYSDYGLLDSTTNPNGSVVLNSYYLTGDISSVDKDSTDVVDIDYNHIGQIVSQDYANGIDQTYTYNPLWDYRLQNKETTNATGTTLENLNYYYDRTGNISAITDSGSEQLSLKTYNYDSVDRLINAGFTSSTTVADISQLDADIAAAMSDYEQDVLDRANDLLEKETITTVTVSSSTADLNPIAHRYGRSQDYGATFPYVYYDNQHTVGKYKSYRIYRSLLEYETDVLSDVDVTSATLTINNPSLAARRNHYTFFVQVFAQGTNGDFSYDIPVSNQIYPYGQSSITFDLDLSYIEDVMESDGELNLVIRQQADINGTYPGNRYQYMYYNISETDLNLEWTETNTEVTTQWKHRPKDLLVPTYPDVAQIIADHASTSSTTLETDMYTYSETGNILTHNNDTYSYTNGTFPQAATAFAGNTYTYDDNGNLSSKDDGSVVSTYIYDWNDRLSSVDQGSTDLGTYTYTDARQRLSKTVGTSTKYYINNSVEYDGDYTNHVFAGANRVLTSDVDGLHYTHKDHLQSTSMTTDSNGIVEEAVDYKAFGSERSRAGSHESDYSFTDQERDTETGLMYYDARYYDAELKRFTGVDPAVVRLGTVEDEFNQLLTDPQQQNTYTYVANNPIKYNDPSGEIIPAIIAIGFAAWTAYDSYNAFVENKAEMGTAGALGVAAKTAAVDTVIGKVTKPLKVAEKVLDKTRFPDNPDDMSKVLGSGPSKVRTKNDGTIETTWQPNANTKIRHEEHPMKFIGERYNPRHTDPHYHVETKIDSNRSWNNPNNINKIKPDGYTKGSGTGFKPGEKFPGK